MPSELALAHEGG